MAIGPSGISSIEYVKKIPGAFVIEDLERLNEALTSFFRGAELFKTRAMEIRRFAYLYHNVEKNSKETLEILKKVKASK